jgi:2-polyprenyl-3-methyl-5-hydroxy-6-metoxy-1,4-benzoquinol methylase
MTDAEMVDATIRGSGRHSALAADSEAFSGTMNDVESIDTLIRQVWDSPDAEALRRLRDVPFVAHNIPLGPGIGTRPGEPFISETGRARAIRDALKLFVEPPLSAKTAVDLGCLEGGLSFELRRAGLSVLGVEGREENLRKCLLLRDYYKALDGLAFELHDVRDFEPQNNFDVVVCSGLLYHLDDPAGYIGRLGRLTAEGGMLYLDTHVAPEDIDLAGCAYSQELSPIKTTIVEGARIRYREYRENVSMPESSIGNSLSLWMDTASHLDLLSRAGFGRVFELHGYHGMEEPALARTYCRKYFVALKGPSGTGGPATLR